MPRLAFLNRQSELARLHSALDAPEPTLSVVYGRRRLGKSRLVQEALAGRSAVYYVGDERDAALQREAVAREIDVLLPGFARVSYPDWGSLLDRFFAEAPAGSVLALDELPALIATSPELPSVLQKIIDHPRQEPRHLILTGSSQRMMHGSVISGSAPLYGRAREILRLEPLQLGWVSRAFKLKNAAEAVDQYAVWGGVPRYWELARGYPDRLSAIESLLLDPLGVLHREPERLLLDDLDEITRAASLLSLVGNGVHRVSEMASRLGVPSTSLSRPLGRLLDLGILHRETPFGRSVRDTKRTWYRIIEPLMRFWYRFVQPNRSRLAAGQVREVRREVASAWPEHVGMVWEDLARSSTARLRVSGRQWLPGARWWGRGSDGKELELDIVAPSSTDPAEVLVGEAKHRCTVVQARRLLSGLQAKAERCPELKGKRLHYALWVLHGPGGAQVPGIVTPTEVASPPLAPVIPE
ncbi:MAG: ATP-binding protein [Myxococcota bacterium]